MMKRELDSRTNAHGERITLVWYPVVDRVAIELESAVDGVPTRTAPVPKARARDAFDHPYLYLEAVDLREALAA
jgi:hypothetical protein